MIHSPNTTRNSGESSSNTQRILAARGQLMEKLPGTSIM